MKDSIQQNTPKRNRKGLQAFLLQYELYGETYEVEVLALNEKNAKRKLKRIKANKRIELDKMELLRHKEEVLREVAENRFVEENTLELLTGMVQERMNVLLLMRKKYLAGVYLPFLGMHKVWVFDNERKAFECAVCLANVVERNALYMQIAQRNMPAISVEEEETEEGMLNTTAKEVMRPAFNLVRQEVLPSLVSRSQRRELESWLLEQVKEIK